MNGKVGAIFFSNLIHSLLRVFFYGMMMMMKTFLMSASVTATAIAAIDPWYATIFYI
jgi:hypothetical protein